MKSITDSQLYIDKIISVTKNRTIPGHINCRSRHSDCFVYILSGEADYTFGSRIMKAEPGNILYLSRNSQYTIDVSHPNYSYFYFDFNFSDSDITDYNCFVFKNKLLEGLEGDFINLYKKWHRGSIADKATCMSLVYEIYSRVITSSVYSYITPSRKDDIDLAIKTIRENLHDPELSVTEIANKIQISEVHFRRLFRKTHNISPMKYVTTLRIEKAKEYLRLKEMSVAQIAEKCGFTSSYYFSRVFKSETGLTPTEYINTFMF